MNGRYTMPELENHFAFLDAHLASRPWFAGDAFSVADIQMSFGVEAATARGVAADRPNVVINVQFQPIKAAIVCALAAFPEAKARVVEALDALEGGQ